MTKKRIMNGIAVLGLFIAVFPTVWAIWSMVCGAFMPLDEIQGYLSPVLLGEEGMAAWTLIPSYPTLEPILEILLDTPQFFVMFWNSMGITVFSVAGQLLVGAPAAWALSRLRFRRRQILLGLYISLMLMPFQVTMVPNYIMNNTLGIMDTHLSIILPFMFSAFPVFIMTKSFDSVHMSVIEAAKVDGSGYIRTFLKIGLPLGMPGILSALVVGFFECWNAIEQPMLFLKTPSLWPLSLYLPQIAAEKLGVAMAASLIMLIPAALVFLFGQKYLVLGIQSTGIKE